MKGVVDNIDVRAIGDTDEWMLLDDFEFFGIKVEKGFVTDFASIPKPVRFWLNPVGKIRPASLIHDKLYNLRGKLEVSNIDPKWNMKHVYGLLKGQLGDKYLSEITFNSWTDTIQLTRKGCDLIFMRIMECIEYSLIKRKAVYRGVRLGGWWFWNKKE